LQTKNTTNHQLNPETHHHQEKARKDRNKAKKKSINLERRSKKGHDKKGEEKQTHAGSASIKEH